MFLILSATLWPYLLEKPNNWCTIPKTPVEKIELEIGNLTQSEPWVPKPLGQGPTLGSLETRTCTGPKPPFGGGVAVEAAKGEQRQLWLWAHRQQTLPTVTHQSHPGDTYRGPRGAPFRSTSWITQKQRQEKWKTSPRLPVIEKKRQVLDSTKHPWLALLPHSTVRHGKPTPKNCSSSKGPTQNSQFLEQSLEDLGPILP